MRQANGCEFFPQPKSTPSFCHCMNAEPVQRFGLLPFPVTNAKRAPASVRCARLYAHCSCCHSLVWNCVFVFCLLPNDLTLCTCSVRVASNLSGICLRISSVPLAHFMLPMEMFFHVKFRSKRVSLCFQLCFTVRPEMDSRFSATPLHVACRKLSNYNEHQLSSR